MCPRIGGRRDRPGSHASSSPAIAEIGDKTQIATATWAAANCAATGMGGVLGYGGSIDLISKPKTAAWALYEIVPLAASRFDISIQEVAPEHLGSLSKINVGVQYFGPLFASSTRSVVLRPRSGHSWSVRKGTGSSLSASSADER